MVFMDAFITTHIGKVRKVNEDSITLLEGSNRLLMAIADGMSKPQGGKIASQMIVEELSDLDLNFPSGNFKADEYELVRKKIISANNKILEKKQRMGSTIIALYMNPVKVNFLWAGDSRGYLFRQNELKQITLDDNAIEARIRDGSITREESLDFSFNSLRGNLTKHIGKIPITINNENYINVNYILPEPDDIYLICSDGITNMVRDFELAEVLLSNSSASVKKIAN